MQCQYAVSKEDMNSVSTDTHVESADFPVYLKIQDNYFNLQLENNLCLPVSYYKVQTKAQSLENIHQQNSPTSILFWNTQMSHSILKKTDFYTQINYDTN